jgi:uncharacterized protein
MIPRIAGPMLMQLLRQDKPVLVLGARQVGKTTLIAHALPEEDCAVLNLDIPTDLAQLTAAAALDPITAVQTLTAGRRYLVIDEAQRWEGVGRTVKGWFDARVDCRIVLLGSSSLDLLDRTSEPLTGRNVKLYLPTLLLREVLRAQPWHIDGIDDTQLQTHFAAQLSALLDTVLVYGLYPEAVTSVNKRQYLLNLAQDYALKDVFQTGLTRSPDALRTLLQLLAHQISSEVSVNELSTRIGLARPTVERYLQLLQDTFIVFRLPAFSRNLRNEISKSAKYYFWDIGLRNAVINNFAPTQSRTDVGALWENVVIAEFVKYNALMGSPSTLYFWRTKDQSEVDLIVETDGALAAYEIKWRAPTGSRVPGRAFTSAYAAPVNVLHSGNALQMLPQLV